MKDLEREKELERLICERADAYSEKKWVRLKRTFFVLSGVVYLVAHYFGEMSNIKEYLEWLVVAPIFAGLILIISYGILYYIITNSMEEEKEIAELKGKYTERKYFINKEDE